MTIKWLFLTPALKKPLKRVVLGVKNPVFWGVPKYPQKREKLNGAFFQFHLFRSHFFSLLPIIGWNGKKPEKTRFYAKMQIAQNVPRIRHLLERPRRTFYPTRVARNPILQGFTLRCKNTTFCNLTRKKEKLSFSIFFHRKKYRRRDVVYATLTRPRNVAWRMTNLD